MDGFKQLCEDVHVTVPAEILKVIYGGMDLTFGDFLAPVQVFQVADLGNQGAGLHCLSKMSTKDNTTLVPKCVLESADPNAFYAIIMTDPDSPSRANPKFREWHHWLLGNVPGSALHSGDVVKEGEILSDYIGSMPPKDTGIHRYIFLVYKQPGKVKFDERRLSSKSPDYRSKHSVSKFSTKYSLGDPVAGTYYESQWDDQVVRLHKAISTNDAAQFYIMDNMG